MMDSCDLRFITDVPFFFPLLFFLYCLQELRGGRGIVRLDLGENSVTFFLCHLQIESGDLIFVVGHCLFKTSISMAYSWWYFNGWTSALLLVLPDGREIFLGLSLARTISVGV